MSNERSPRALCSTTMGTSGTGLLSLFRVEAQLAGCTLDCTLRATVQLREAFSEENYDHRRFCDAFDRPPGPPGAGLGRPNAALRAGRVAGRRGRVRGSAGGGERGAPALGRRAG